MPAIERDFDEDQVSKPAGPRFKLGGDWFQCVPDIPYTVLSATASTIAMPAGSDTEKMLQGARAIVEVGEFFDAVVVDEDLGRFHAVLSDKNRCPSSDRLQGIVNWLFEAYANRPTSPPSDLPASSESGSTTSTDGSFSPVTEPVPTG